MVDSRLTSNVAGVDNVKMLGRFFVSALKTFLDKENVAKRRDKGLNIYDSLFNFVKLTFLENAVLKYRRMVQFGDKVVLDSTFPPFPSLAFDKRITNYVNNLDMREIPTGIVSISTTNCCPYSCPFCSTNARRVTNTDLDEDLLKSTITAVEEMGAPTIILHGGEPMYRYDRFLRLVKHVSSDTCLWMFTSGYGVTQERANELKENGLFGVWVSLDHFEPDVHNSFRGSPKAFERALQAVEAFKKAGVYTCLSLVPPDDLLQSENFIKYYDLAKKLGVAEIRVMEKKPSGREARCGVLAHSPVLANLQKKLYSDSHYSNHPPLSGLSTWLEKDQALGCQCRFEYLFITSKGDVQPCEVSEVTFGNIKEEPFEKIFMRISKSFSRCSTGCIPMVMYPEIRAYQKDRPRMSYSEKTDRAAKIIEGFQAKGSIPKAYRPIWSYYEKRLKLFHKRQSVK
ncbi:MAG: radical SAM/SPASM domain-containing protein [Pseudomonadota bacterium]